MANCEQQSILKHTKEGLVKIRLEESPVPYVGTIEVVEPVSNCLMKTLKEDGLRKLDEMRREAIEKKSGKVLELEDIDPVVLTVLPEPLKNNLMEGNNMIIDMAGNLIPSISYKAKQA